MRELEIPNQSVGQLHEVLLGKKATVPAKVDLGIFGHEAELLQKLSETNGCEYASVATVSDGEAALTHRAIKGDQESVPIDYISGKLITIHSHTSNTPFSNGDLQNLFLAGYGANPEQMAALVATSDLKMLAVTTPKTLRSIILAKIIFMNLPEWRQAAEHDESKIAEFSDRNIGIQAGSASRMYFLTRIAQKTNLILYSCPIKSNIASLAI